MLFHPVLRQPCEEDIHAPIKWRRKTEAQRHGETCPSSQEPNSSFQPSMLPPASCYPKTQAGWALVSILLSPSVSDIMPLGLWLHPHQAPLRHCPLSHRRQPCPEVATEPDPPNVVRSTGPQAFFLLTMLIISSFETWRQKYLPCPQDSSKAQIHVGKIESIMPQNLQLVLSKATLTHSKHQPAKSRFNKEVQCDISNLVMRAS